MTTDHAEFLSAAGDLLASDAERHTVALSVTATVAAGANFGDEPVRFVWHAAGARVDGAAVFTIGYPLLLSAVTADSIDGLVSLLRKEKLDVRAVNGEVEAVEAFARAWTGEDVSGATPTMRQRLYRLTSLRDVPAPPGSARIAVSADISLIQDWFRAFGHEAHEEAQRETSISVVTHRVVSGLVWLWERSGVPVAMAARNATAGGVSRIGPVYTPPEFRREGFGTAVTAACTQAALDEGASGVVLFTDLANPTSNAIYQSIGYEPVADRVILELG